MSDPARWSTPANIAAAVRRRWTDGTLLRAFATDDPFRAIAIPLRGPSAGDLGDHFDAAREWSNDLRHASRGGRAYTLLTGRIGGRLTGSTEVPIRAVVESYEQAWLLLGSQADAAAFRQLVDSSEHVPRARKWALGSPLAAVALAPIWQSVLGAYTWLDTHRGSGHYLRQVSAPGVDTKFIERHRSALGSMLGVSTAAGAFARELGLASKPATVRLRFDPAVLDVPSGLSEAVLRTEELGALDAHPRRALIVENEITYLSVPVRPGCVVLWGKGYDADQPASLQWLSGTEVVYWGDIDTHGFAILDRVRAHLPNARSVLMDRETLLAHESTWGREPAPTDVGLSRLDAAERMLYSDLVTDRYGPTVRLEQERINWEWALERLEQ
ncbi:Wadjet anti-phage system protein JetD domain-containing protein [Yonghaparkia sp. Soil809]|uniref:Wadjet anti-phage system protein JetD domain-containing protein n=1 Tax=Yonghaparkia sp. Soil809 TaxID=1736417 RepID=UPI0006FF4981|nr:Wadjet anti-phage system protein JetD domain-containing protein [Yonghaparkia sp. Soil809]KRF31510.1 hypothetical protein ASG83_12145 [Yonghaparkia sp. Soil809]